MDIRTLKYFITIAEELNVTKAAEKLHISQPPLSMQIKSLEYELKTTLFIRGKRKLELTETGRLLYRRAREIINLTNKAKEEIISMSDGVSGTVSLGLVEGMAPDIVGEWFSDFIKKYPKVKFRILDGNSDDLTEKLRSGIISLAVLTPPYDQNILNGFEIGHECMAAFLPKEHPLAQNGKYYVTIEDLANQKLIVPSRRVVIDRIYRWFQEKHLEPQIVCEMDSYLDAAALAKQGFGISIFPQTAYVPNTNLVSKVIEGPNRFMDYLFAWRKGHPLPSIEEAFIDFIKERYNSKKATS